MYSTEAKVFHGQFQNIIFDIVDYARSLFEKGYAANLSWKLSRITYDLTVTFSNIHRNDGQVNG